MCVFKYILREVCVCVCWVCVVVQEEEDARISRNILSFVARFP